MQLSGYHAITRSNYEEIVRHGFKLGKGLRGTGVYFWEDNCGYGISLSTGWYEFCNRKKAYEDCGEKAIAVIQGFFEPEDEYCFLNIADRETRGKIFHLAKNRMMDMQNREGLYAIYDVFFRQLEILTGYRFQVIETTVNTFGIRDTDFPSQVLGQPYCYLVREPHIIRTKLYGGDDIG
jgi:hypothetical protein